LGGEWGDESDGVVVDLFGQGLGHFSFPSGLRVGGGSTVLRGRILYVVEKEGNRV
jgi:hypothetical protein